MIYRSDPRQIQLLDRIEEILHPAVQARLEADWLDADPQSCSSISKFSAVQSITLLPFGQ